MVNHVSSCRTWLLERKTRLRLRCCQSSSGAFLECRPSPPTCRTLSISCLKICTTLSSGCPRLNCHIHVSGVSQTTGKSFFIILYDAALAANDAAKRVFKSMYTHLHSEPSMALTAALWSQSLGRRPHAASAATAAASLLAAPSTKGGSGPDFAAGADASGAGTSGALSGTPEDATGGSSRRPGYVAGGPLLNAANVEDPSSKDLMEANTAPPDRIGCVPVLPVWYPGGADDGDQSDAAPPPPGSPLVYGQPVDNFAVLSEGFRRPEPHEPSAEAREQVEALFTALRNSSAQLIRKTLAVARVALCARYNVTQSPALHGMLRWL